MMLVDAHLKLFPPEGVARSSVPEMLDQLSVYEPGFKALLVGYAFASVGTSGLKYATNTAPSVADAARDVWMGVAHKLTKGRR